MKRKLNLPKGVILASRVHTRSVGEKREEFQKGDIVEVLTHNGLVNFIGEVTGINSWQTESQIPAYGVAALTAKGHVDKRKKGRFYHGHRAESLRFLCKSE